MTAPADLRAKIFGDGSSEDSGMPLPSSFAQVILEGIADGLTTTAALLPLASHEMTSQGRLLMRKYRCDSPDEAVGLYLRDMLAWLCNLGLASGSGDGPWHPGKKFAYHENLVIKPARAQQGRIGVHVYEKAEREQRNTEDRQRRSCRELLRQGLRTRSSDDEIDELVWSIQEFGLLPNLTPIQDQHGLVLVGNRRTLAAQRAGVEFEPVVMTFSDSEEGDRQRLRLALASNLGVRKLAKADRQRIARYLYGTGEWTQGEIAKSLGVSQQSVALDLTNISKDLGIDDLAPGGQAGELPPKRRAARRPKPKVDDPALNADLHSRLEAGERVVPAEVAKQYDDMSADTVERALFGAERWREGFQEGFQEGIEEGRRQDQSGGAGQDGQHVSPRLASDHDIHEQFASLLLGVPFERRIGAVKTFESFRCMHELIFLNCRECPDPSRRRV